MNNWLHGNGQMKRKANVTGNEEINIHISSPMVQNEALAVAKSLGNDQFKVSTGW
jgi:hypothetical protein